MQRKSKDWHKRELKFEMRPNSQEGQGVVLVGAITEEATAALDGILLQLSAAPGAAVVFDLSGIEFLNSIGIQQWMRFLGALKDREVVLDQVSTGMCEHVTLLAGFTGNGKVRSFHLPYFCAKCREQKAVLVDAATAPRSEPPEPPVCECGKPMALDMMDEDYTVFMELVDGKG